MRRILDEIFVSDALAVRRITASLARLAKVIEDITKIFNAVREKCDPGIFYDRIRPWYHGASAHAEGWVFDGVELVGEERVMWGGKALSGPSAGQSALIHAFDVFLGVDHTMHGHGHGHGHGSASASSSKSPVSPTSSSSSPASPSTTPAPSSSKSSHYSSPDSTFLQRMQAYMPRHHRLFLIYLSTLITPTPSPVRTFVKARSTHLLTFSNADEEGGMEAETPLMRSYNAAVDALKRFRDSHIRVATLYIVSMSRRAKEESEEAERQREKQGPAVGTGGTQLVPFLKGARDNTLRTVIR